MVLINNRMFPHDLTFHPWRDLFISWPSQLPGEHTAERPFGAITDYKPVDGRALIEVYQHQSRASQAIRRYMVERVIPLSGKIFLFIHNYFSNHFFIQEKFIF